MTKQLSTGIIVAATTPTTIFNHAVFLNDVKDRYLDKGYAQILMTGATVIPFSTVIPDPLDTTGNTIMTQ